MDIMAKLGFNLFKSKKKQEHFLQCDIHSHILPEIDDGSKSLEESLDMLQEMHSLGYKKLIATPHVMMDVYPNSREIILDKLAMLQEAANFFGLEITLQAAAEYYLDEQFMELIRKREILTFGKNYLLFESSYLDRPIFLEDAIFQMQAKGYIPVLAHPERYRYITDKSEYKKLKDLGVLFQVNLNSFVGMYGKSAKEKARYLADNSMVSFLGSDLHSKKQTEYLKKVFASGVINDIFEKNRILNNTLL